MVEGDKVNQNETVGQLVLIAIFHSPPAKCQHLQCYSTNAYFILYQQSYDATCQ